MTRFLPWLATAGIALLSLNANADGQTGISTNALETARQKANNAAKDAQEAEKKAIDVQDKAEIEMINAALAYCSESGHECGFEAIGARAFKQKGRKFPRQLKCTSVDYRTFSFCPELAFFEPSARVFFDSGSDDEDEVDIFNDGNLNLTVQLASIYIPWRFGISEGYDSWSWGPVVGAGIGSPADDAGSDSQQASSAPVVLFSAGGMLQYDSAQNVRDKGTTLAFEAGWAYGYSADENIGDKSDSAFYVGLRINVPLSGKKSPKPPPETPSISQ